MSITTLTGFSQPSWAIFHPRPAPIPGSNEPRTNEIELVNSCATSGQQAPNQAMLASSRIGMMRLASNVNDPTTATTCSSTAWRAQLAPSFGSPLLSHVMMSSGRPATPPLSLMYCS